jgi:farnesyl-diphosphate farnesyltransferase
MQRAASLGYLLARTSDTLTDAVAAPVEDRLNSLQGFIGVVEGQGHSLQWSGKILAGTANPKERQLLGNTMRIIDALEKLPDHEGILVREVFTTITSGQIFDLNYFSHACTGNPLALPDDETLENYTWRVAGSVGEFWTRLGFLTLGDQFSNAPESELLPLGRNYGKGLQLVNILRDLPVDLAQGRCYLPVKNLLDHEELFSEYALWRNRASGWINDGLIYAATLRSRRARAGSYLPALLGKKTLDKLKDATWAELTARIKISRSEVYRSLVTAFFS